MHKDISPSIPFTSAQLWQALEYLSLQAGEPTVDFISGILARLEASQQKLEGLESQFLNLSFQERQIFLSRLGLKNSSNIDISSDESPPLDPSPLPLFTLEQLKDMSIPDLVKSKPRMLWINKNCWPVKSWKDVTMRFVKELIAGNYLRKDLLPFFSSVKSRKVYVNFFPGQPNGSEAGLFVKVADNFYVDIKHNAKYHILNIWWTLKKLNLAADWQVELELRR